MYEYVEHNVVSGGCWKFWTPKLEARYWGDRNLWSLYRRVSNSLHSCHMAIEILPIMLLKLGQRLSPYFGNVAIFELLISDGWYLTRACSLRFRLCNSSRIVRFSLVFVSATFSLCSRGQIHQDPPRPVYPPHGLTAGMAVDVMLYMLQSATSRNLRLGILIVICNLPFNFYDKSHDSEGLSFFSCRNGTADRCIMKSLHLAFTSTMLSQRWRSTRKPYSKTQKRKYIMLDPASFWDLILQQRLEEQGLLLFLLLRPGKGATLYCTSDNLNSHGPCYNVTWHTRIFAVASLPKTVPVRHTQGRTWCRPRQVQPPVVDQNQF